MRRHLATATFILAGLWWTLGQAVLPDMGSDTGERYDAVSRAPALESLSAGLLVLAAGFLVLGSLVAAHRLDRWAGHRGRTLMLVGSALTGLGALWLAGGRSAFNLMFARVVGTESLPRDTAVELLESSGGAGFVPLVLMLPALLLGPLLLAVGLRRSGLTGWLPLAAWVLGVGLFLATEFSSKAAETAGIAVASTGLALIGRALDTAAAPSAAKPARVVPGDVTSQVPSQ